MITCFPTGLDYESCPTMEECENNAVESFWRKASATVNSALELTSYISKCVLGGSGKLKRFKSVTVLDYFLWCKYSYLDWVQCFSKENLTFTLAR